MKIFIHIIIYFLLSCSIVCGQDLEGIVFDSQTKQRIARVYIYNTANDAMQYNNARGEFEIEASAGDTLVAVVKGYHADTLVVKKEPVIVFNLRRSTIWLNEVSIIARRSPSDILQQRKSEFSEAYRLGDPGSIFSIGSTGAGISIDALYSLLSRRGKNARYLQEMIQREYENNIIDSKFTATMVRGVTNLRGAALDDFMQQYRPSYNFITQASDYQLGTYIRSSYNLYRKNPGAYRLPPLPKLLQDDETLESEDAPKD